MSHQKPAIAIVGLGVVGASVGLCLRKAGAVSQVVGHDKSSEASSRARKTGAVDRTEWNLVSACEKADVVVLALPFGALRESLEAIAPYLRPGCVVLDTSTLKAPVLGWADEILSSEVHFVGLDPIPCGQALPSADPADGQAAAPVVEGCAQARADLFAGGVICVVPSSRAVPDAVQLATDLVAILGARPFFLDAVEHDGLMALAGHLPPLLALSLMQTGASGPAWKEARKLAGHWFESATGSLPEDPTASEEWLANRENLVRWIDALCGSLGTIRDLLVEQDAATLAKLIGEAGRERSEWLRRRSAGDWDDTVRQEMPKPNLLQPFFGGLWPRRPKPTDKPKGGGDKS